MTTRTFELKPAARCQVPLLIGIVGASSSGKTFSALRLATGIQRVVGGSIAFVDTEHCRATHYSDLFKFDHLDMGPPFGPLDYLAAIQHCVAKGAKTIIVDSMTHEHASEGGVMDQIEKWLDEKCGADWKAREKMGFLAHARIKPQRKKLNTFLVQSGVNMILCYRACEKIKPVKGGEPLHLGWMPETTSTIHYDMVQRFLLTPGCQGVPALVPETDAEKRMVKTPAQFKDIFESAKPLSEGVGQRLAEWAAGAKPGKSPVEDLIESYQLCATRDNLTRLEDRRATLWPALKKPDQSKLKAAATAAGARLTEQDERDAGTRSSDVPPDDPSTSEPTELFDNATGQMPVH